MKHTLMTTCVILVAGVLAIALPQGARAATDEVAAAEAILTRQGCRLARLKAKPGRGVAVVRYTLLEPTELSGFYLRNTQQRSAKLLQKRGTNAQVPAGLSVYPYAIVCSTPSGVRHSS